MCCPARAIHAATLSNAQRYQTLTPWARQRRVRANAGCQFPGGREGVRKSLEMLFAAFPDLRFEIEQILASGDFVVVRYNVTGTHKGNFAGIAATNKPVNFHSCSVVELRNGKAVRIRAYADNATLYQQLGVLSLPKAAAAG
jgi:predicted ester cyclase